MNDNANNDLIIKATSKLKGNKKIIYLTISLVLTAGLF